MLDALISAGANLLGGLFNRNQQADFNAQQLAFGRQQLDMQREFAQHGIQWKVADAQAAGLHPLAALGAQTSSPSPVSVGGSAPTADFGSLGQDLGRAAKALQTEATREAVVAKQEREADLEGKKLDNVAKADAIATRRMGQLGPPMPSSETSWNSLLAHLDRSPPRSAGYPVSDDRVKTAPVYANDAAGANYLGVPIRVHPRTADAQFFEQRYGEEHPITEFAGWGIAAADAYESLKQLPNPVENIRGRDSPRYRRVRGAARSF